VDLLERAASPGELRRFAQRFGVEALLDRGSRRFADLGLGAARLSDERWLDKLAEEPLLLRMPLVRHQQQLTIGDAEPIWREWAAR
jgi:arsenate reductase-like glutaredoxin family protein